MNIQANSNVGKNYACVAVVVGAFVLLCAVTWQKWVPPFIDSGREMNAPLRLLGGESLYRQIYFQFGPLPPYFNALLYRILGVHLNTLYSAGLIGSFLLTMMVFYLARNFLTPTQAMLGTLAVETLCIFKYGGHTIFPYTFGALYGTLLGTASLILMIHSVSRPKHLLLYSGILGGLAFLCKLEFGFAIAATALVLIFTLPRQLRMEASLRTFFPMLGIPAIIYGWIILQVSPTVFLKESFFLPQYIPSEQFFFNSAKLGLDRPVQTIIESTGAILSLVSIGSFMGLASIHLSRWISTEELAERHRWLRWLYGTFIAATTVLLLIIFHLGTAAELSPLRTLPLLCALMIFGSWKRRDEPEGRSVLLLSVYCLVLLARVITRVPSGGAYGAFLVPVPIIFFTYVVMRVFPKNFAIFRQGEERASLLLQILFLLINVAIFIKVGGHYYIEKCTKVQTERGTMCTDATTGGVMNSALSFIRKNTNPGEYIAFFPEGSSLNFLSARPVPMRYEILIPGFVNSDSTEETIRELDQKNVKYIFIVNRPTSEFGKTAFGIDYGQTLMHWIEQNYKPDRVFGTGVGLDSKIGSPHFFIKCYERN